MRRKLLTSAYWAVPSIFCLILYWPGLLCWFQQDDFVWLNLVNQAHNGRELFSTIFHSTVQGTWRPLSERVYFLVFGHLFGSDALPYRIWVFLTMFANLALLAAIVSRMTRSRAVGFWAAILWIANSKLATVMSWSCEYILVACGFFLLLAMYFFLRYTETGERRFYVWTWLTFLTGFLAMETNVVFPLLAAGYALFCARKYFRASLPFFIASAVYSALHLHFAINHGTGPYTMHIDGAIPLTIASYWRRTFEPVNLRYMSPFSPLAGTAEMIACSVALLGFVICQTIRKQWLALVFLSWYFILLIPVIPLRDHISDYYLTLPAMGMATLGAYALVSAWRANAWWRIAGVVIVAMFLAQNLPVARRGADWFRARAARQQALVMGVARAHGLHPGKAIVLDGINDDLFWGAISQRPFLFLGITDVYLAPGSEKTITPYPVLDEVSNYVLPADQLKRGLDRDELVVYRVGEGPLKNITHRYVPPEDASGPIRIDMSSPLIADRLGPTWYPLDGGVRWMPRTASVRMPGPRAAGQKLYLSAICPAAQVEQGPLDMTVTIDGMRSAPVQFTKGNEEATFAFPMPAETVGKAEIEIAVELSRTARIGADRRDLGLAFGRIEIK